MEKRQKGVFTYYTKQMALAGNNIIIHGNNAYALYSVIPHNYNLNSDETNDDHIGKLTNMIEVLSSTIPNIVFSFFKSSYIFGRDKKIERLNRTAQIWGRQKAADPHLTSSIESTLVDNNLLAVKLNLHSNKDVEDLNFKDIIKSLYNSTTTAILNEHTAVKNLENLCAMEKRIRRILSKYCTPVSKDFLVSAYLRCIYPNYNLVAKDMGASTDFILGELHQKYSPYFGYFKMSNDGVEMFNAEPMETYGTVLKVQELPVSIYSENMNLDISGMKTTVRVLRREEALKRFGVIRADLEFEGKNAQIAGARDLGELGQSLGLIDTAIQKAGSETFCEFNSYITLVDTDFQKLKTRRQKLIGELKEINVIVTPAADQVQAYIDNFIMLAGDERAQTPGVASSFYHVSDLRFPLSFQTDFGSLVGDFDAKNFVPEIGSNL